MIGAMARRGTGKADIDLGLCDVSELTYVERDGLLVADLGIAGCQARVVKYQAGAEIPLHRHTRRSVKLLIRGAVTFATPEGPLGQAADGTFYWCGTGLYRGDVGEDSYLLVIDEEGSERIEVDSQKADDDLDASLLNKASRSGGSA